MADRSAHGSGDRMIARLRRAIPRVLFVEEFRDIEGLTLTCVQGSDALIDFLA
jgi:hypothetical protein